jgi:hypothetical protein
MSNIESQSVREAQLRQRQLQNKAKKENSARRRKVRLVLVALAVFLLIPLSWGGYTIYQWREAGIEQNKAQLRRLLNKKDLVTDDDMKAIEETVKALGHAREYYALKKEYDDADTPFKSDKISDKLYQKLIEWSY